MKNNICLCFCILLCISSIAQDLEDFNMPITSTVNLLNRAKGDYSQPRNPFLMEEKVPVNFQTKKWLNLQIVDTKSDFEKVFSLDVDVKGHWTLLKGNDEFHKYTEEHNQSSSTRIMFSGTLILGDQNFNQISLKDDAKTLIGTQPLEFVKAYGDHYVSHVRLVKKIFVFLEINDLDQSTIVKLNGVHQGEADAGFWSVQSNVTASQIINNAYHNGNCHITIESFGFFDATLLRAITDVLNNPKNNEAIDLLPFISSKFFDLMNIEDKNPDHFYTDKVGFSNFVGFGVPLGYYNALYTKAQKVNKYWKFNGDITQLRERLENYIDASTCWGKVLPDNIFQEINSNIDSCKQLAAENIDALTTDCRSDCQTLQNCCNIRTDFQNKYTILKRFEDRIHRTYKFEPITNRNFKIKTDRSIGGAGQIHGLKTYNIIFQSDSANIPNSAAFISYNRLNDDDIKIHAIFSCQIRVTDPNLINFIDLAGELIEGDKQDKKIPIDSLASNTVLTFNQIPADNHLYEITGDFVLLHAEDIYKIKNIGFSLDLTEKRPGTDFTPQTFTIKGNWEIKQGLEFHCE